MHNAFFSICTKVDYSGESIEKMKLNFPVDDFVDVGFDLPSNQKLKKLLIIFSTERSGSTYFCDLINRAGICLPHEYFQPYNYMPLLADRWGALEGEKINIKEYCQALIKYRTSANGILGLNLHGSHIYLFEQARQHFGDVDVEYFFLKRDDIVEQAVSYEIAFQNSAWSSEYGLAKNTLKYDFDSIMKRLWWLEFDLLKINVFCKRQEILPSVINFKELITDVSSHMSRLFDVRYSDVGRSFKKQSTDINKDWVKQFCHGLDLSLERPLNYTILNELSFWKKIKKRLSKIAKQG
jgi:LPS sulfotransferase NodH